MTPIAPSTCGFLPLHAYEGAELERARGIVHAINLFALEGMGIGVNQADPESLRDLTLQGMLDAVRVVERWNGRPKAEGISFSCAMVPDDRLTAAVYTLLHFHNPRACDGNDDDIPVRFDARRYGETTTHFLLIGARPRAVINGGDDVGRPDCDRGDAGGWRGRGRSGRREEDRTRRGGDGCC